MKKYIISIALDVSPDADEHLQTAQRIEDDVRSPVAPTLCGLRIGRCGAK